MGGYEMTHIASRSMEEIPNCSPRSSVKVEGHKGQKINDLGPIWVFADNNSSFNSEMTEMIHKALRNIEEVH